MVKRKNNFRNVYLLVNRSRKSSTGSERVYRKCDCGKHDNSFYKVEDFCKSSTNSSKSELNGKCGGFSQTLLGRSLRPSHNSDCCPLDMKEASQWTQIGVTDGRLWTGDFSVQSYGHEVTKRWSDSDYVLFRFTDALLILQAAPSLFPTIVMMSCFTAPHRLNSESASLQLASYHLQPDHGMMSFFNTAWVQLSKTNLKKKNIWMLTLVQSYILKSS